MDENLHAEAAAHVAGAHAQLGEADLQDHLGHHRPDHVHALRRDPQRRAVVLAVVFADGAARLHGVHDQALVDQPQRHHAMGLGEGGIGGGAVSELPVEDDVVLDVIVHKRRAGLGGLEGADDMRPGGIVDLDQLGGVLGLLQRVGHDQRHRIANMADAALGQHRPRGVGARGAVAVLQRHQAGHIAEACQRHVLAREDEMHTGRLLRRTRVDAPDVGMGVRAAQHIGAQRRPGQLGVVGITAAAGQQARVLDPANRITDTELGHFISPLR